MKVTGMNEEDMRKEIETDLSLNMFVEAGAGAGKTTLIVSRIVNLLSAGVEPGEIVVITFTNAAAEELRGRIISKVTERSKEEPELEDKLHRLNDMNISTIHSFCNVLLHEQGLFAKLPVDIEMLQDDEEIKEKKRYFDAYLRTLTKNDWDTLELNAGPRGSRFTIRRNMEALYMQMVDLPEDTNIKIPVPADETKQKAAFDVLKTIAFGDPAKGQLPLNEKLLSALNSCVNPEKKKDGFKPAASFSEAEEYYCNKGKTPFLKDLSDVLQKDHSLDNENKVYQALLKTKNYSFLSSANFKVIIDPAKIPAANKMISDEINSLLSDDMRGQFPADIKCEDEDKNVISFEDAVKAKNGRTGQGITVAGYAKEAGEYYRKNAEKNRISNDRLLELTRDLILNDDKNALRYFSKKYSRFFVDEFQDTDRIQESFIYRLASEPDDETKLRDGALFVVGDPKQSIYRFRGAQPAVYFHTKGKMEKLDNARVYELAFNYRSNEKVIKWVNDKFSEAESITPIVDESGVSYVYQRMEAKNSMASGENVIGGIYHLGRPDAEYSLGPVTRHLKSGDKTCEGFGYSEGEQEDDIRDVIGLILDFTKKDRNGNGYFKITDYDSDHNPVARDIRRSDFLLISHNKKMMDDYVSEMKRYGIPVVLDGEEDMKADRGLVVFVRLYQYLVNPRDPFYRTGAEEALRETLHIKSEKELRELSHKILDCMYDDVRSMSAYGMAEYLERQVSALFDKDTYIDHVTALSTQTHIRQMIEKLCLDVTGTGIEMAEAMQKYLDTKLEHELSLEEKTDAVRFMNLHKTKGLEGNIVIILDRRGRREHAPSYCTDGKDFYPGKDKFWTALEAFPQIREQARRSENAEFHRLEYVAVTRAAQAVIFMDVLEKNGLFAKKKLTSRIKSDELDNDLKDMAVFSKKDENTFSYKISDSSNIWGEISKVLLEGKTVNMPYKAENALEYSASSDEYTKKRERKTETAGMVIKESPSGLENNSSSKKSSAIRKAIEEGRNKSDEYNWDLLRPIGNVAGDILHRSMELLVGRKFSGADTDIESTVRQAVIENDERLHAVRDMLIKDLNKEGFSDKTADITEEKTREIVISFITACAKAYDSYLDGIWQEVSNVYPEVHFSYQEKDPEKEDVTVWMNGTADLILEMKDGTYRLIDYKSDNDYLLSEDDMEAVLTEKYTPQLNVYRKVIRTMLGADSQKISTGIISFSQKDVNGNLLPDRKVRVRYTEL
ncbi:MAG: UvrD-helicase domain-containing protein [Lachnospiraceae bacterium]|nr:UvrD-helicase domain-containing protein [Lachnospiraceae bacterium]